MRYLILGVLFVAGCEQKVITEIIEKPYSSGYDDILYSDPNTTIKEYFEYTYLNDTPEPLTTRQEHWLFDNRSEIIDTFEVVEILEADSLAAGLVRYSVGSDIFRQNVWIQRYKGKWTGSTSQYYFDWADDPFDDGDKDRALKIIEKVEEWTGNSANPFD